MRMTAKALFVPTSLLAAACLALTLSVRATAQQKPAPASQKPTPAAPQKAAEAAPASLIERGHYLTTSVAMCVQCHSGRDEAGNILDSAQFRGGAIPVTSPYPNTQWATIAPSLAGLPGFSDEQIISLLTTGNMGDGRPSPRRPMPPFRMNKEDAQAIVAFLRSR
jgi:mono/diheme cytochrome c family protein